MLKGTIRKKDEKISETRKNGMIPAVVYGYKIDEPILINIAIKDFTQTVVKFGKHQIINLETDKNDNLKVLIQDISKNHINDEYIHADFYAPDMNKKIALKVPLKFTGDASAVKKFGGLLIQHKETLKIKALPENIPSNIEINLSVLDKIGALIKCKDIVLPDTVALNENSINLIANIEPPKKSKKVETITEEGKEETVKKK